MQRLTLIVLACCAAACDNARPVTTDGAGVLDRRVDRAPLLPDQARRDIASPPDAAPPNTKFCLKTSGGGGGGPKCAKEEDCLPYKMHCDTSNKTCVWCLTDVHCASNPGTPFCVSSWCVQCRVDKDCTPAAGSTSVCDTWHNTCTGCKSDAECLAAKVGTHCGGSPPFCVGCLSDADCVKGPHSTEKCTDWKCQGCTTDQQCRDAALGGACKIDPVASKNYCISCRVDGDCVKGIGSTSKCFEEQCIGCDTDAECTQAFPQDKVAGCITR
jgi:hypothetical protein